MLFKRGQSMRQNGLAACDGALQRLTLNMALGRAGEVVIPNILKRMVEADALEAVIEVDGPVLLAAQLRQRRFRQVFEAGDPLRPLPQHGGY